LDLPGKQTGDGILRKGFFCQIAGGNQSVLTVPQVSSDRGCQQAGAPIFLVRAVPIIASGNLWLMFAREMNCLHFDGAVDAEGF
jgi:hypothetical protein